MRNMLTFPEKYVKIKENPCKLFFEEMEIWMFLYLMKKKRKPQILDT